MSTPASNAPAESPPPGTPRGVDAMAAFSGPTYQRVRIPYFVTDAPGTAREYIDHELRLYLPRRIPLVAVPRFLAAAQSVADAFGIKGPIQLEVNRAGMCICASCGTEFDQAIADAVGRIRKDQRLRPLSY